MSVQLTKLEKEFVARWIGARPRANPIRLPIGAAKLYWSFDGGMFRSAEAVLDSGAGFVRAIKLLRSKGIEIIFNKSHKDDKLEQAQLMRLPSSDDTGVCGIREDGESVEYALYRAIIAHEKLKVKKERRKDGFQQANRSGGRKAGITD